MGIFDARAVVNWRSRSVAKNSLMAPVARGIFIFTDFWSPQLVPLTLTIRSDEGLALETSAIVSFTAFHYPHQHTVDTPV